MNDKRLEAYAEMLVERCIGVKEGWQVIVKTRSTQSLPLAQAVVRVIARNGAYALPRIASTSFAYEWVRHAPEGMLPIPAELDLHNGQTADAWVIIDDPDNTRDASDIPAERLGLYRKAARDIEMKRMTFEVPWVGCQFPTAALAQDAGMSVTQFSDFLFGACLLDWDAEGARMRKYADRFDAASEVRITAEGTDITLSIEGRDGMVDDGHLNMPGGEFFYCPVEDATNGVITFSEFPGVYVGNEVGGVRLEFKEGRVIDASAQVNEEFLIKTLDSDPGARVLGELGIGCNPGITRHMKNTLFDEKMNGTVHLALGAGFPFMGGKNESSVHWDMVKDLRKGGRIECDGGLVQENGTWLDVTAA